MEVLLHHLREIKPNIVVKEGVFSDGFFDIVVYANKVDQETGSLEQVFVYDEREKKTPMTIVAKTGKIITGRTKKGQVRENLVSLQLFEGSIYRPSNEAYTKVDFETSEVRFTDPISFTKKKKTPLHTLSMISWRL